jgi:hypothetical protein
MAMRALITSVIIDINGHCVDIYIYIYTYRVRCWDHIYPYRFKYTSVMGLIHCRQLTQHAYALSLFSKGTLRLRLNHTS